MRPHLPKPSKKTMLCVCLAAGLMAAAPLGRASISSDLTQFFNDMGASSNTTNGGAFAGQSQNLLTGGSLYVRMPQQSTSLVNIQMPSIKAGCAGIDAFAGSFSHINKEQFVAMLRNIGNNALGYVFQLGIDAVDPLIGNVLKNIRKTAEDINGMSINSCQAAQALVNGVIGKAELASQQGCSSLSSYLNLSSDRADAVGKCSDPIERKNAAQSVRGNPEAAKAAPIELVAGNLMGRVLDKSFPWMTEEERKFLISMTGTYLVTEANSDGKSERRVVEPSIKDERDIVAGVQGTAGDSDITVMLLDCHSAEQTSCDAPSPRNIKSLRAMVNARLDAYVATMNLPAAAWPSSLKDEMAQFVNITSVPVLRLLKMDFAREADLRSTYIDLIASAYAIYYLENMVKKASEAVSNYPSLSEGEETQVKAMRERLFRLKDILARNRTNNEQRAAAATTLNARLAEFEVVLRSNDATLALRVEASRSMGAAQLTR